MRDDGYLYKTEMPTSPKFSLGSAKMVFRIIITYSASNMPKSIPGNIPELSNFHESLTTVRIWYFGVGIYKKKYILGI
jgi:hypothetical protein